MLLFWDSSAVLPLIFKERHSDPALSAWRAGSAHLAWEWMEVETHAALVRRGFAEHHMAAWRMRLEQFLLLGLPPGSSRSIMALNDEWALRSADAGHVFLFRQICEQFPGMKLVTFDGEMAAICQNRGWPIWSAT